MNDNVESQEGKPGQGEIRVLGFQEERQTCVVGVREGVCVCGQGSVQGDFVLKYKVWRP